MVARGGLGVGGVDVHVPRRLAGAGVGVDARDFAEGGALLRAVGRGEGLAGGSEAAAGEARGSRGLQLGEFGLEHRVLVPPLAEGALVQVQPVLLRADDHARAHEAHVRNDLVGREAMAVDKVCADEAACASEAGFAVNGDAAFFAVDGFVREGNEGPDHM